MRPRPDSRMTVRFFGGWALHRCQDRHQPPVPPSRATRSGVPMGRRSAERSPRWRVGAHVPRLRPARPHRRQSRPHPDRQGLARRRRNRTHEQVYDVVWGGREESSDARGQAAGRSATPWTWRTPPGLQHHWRLGAHHSSVVPTRTFDASIRRAFYYARVIEIPDAALDDVRRRPFRSRAARGCAHGDPGAGVYVAHLVHTGC